MRKLVWLDSAVSDVVRLREFIVKENRDAAKRAAQAIQEAVQLLIETPSIGKPVEDLIDFRDLLVRFGAAGYVIRYRIYQEIIYVINVRHYRELDFQFNEL